MRRRSQLPSVPQLCRGGWTTAQVKTAVRGVGDISQEGCCFVLVGINDILGGVSLKTIKTNIKAIIHILSRYGKTVLISTIPPTLNASPEVMHNIAEVNQFILSFHQRRVLVVPLHRHFPPFTPLHQARQLYQRWYPDGTPDHIHLSPRGCTLLSDLITQVAGEAGYNL